MLYFNLKPILAVRQIEKPYAFLVKIGIAPQTAHKIMNDDSHVMRLDNLTLICKALYCEPNDLLQYKPDKNNPIPQNHPLNNLIQKQEDINWQQQLKTMPLSKLRQITDILNKEDNADS